MNFWRCKCGEVTSWESGCPPQPCEACDKCGSTLAMSPESHVEPVSHEWITKYDQNTGKPFEICGRCMRRKKELESG